jgi:hypothetical protein
MEEEEEEEEEGEWEQRGCGVKIVCKKGLRRGQSSMQQIVWCGVVRCGITCKDKMSSSLSLSWADSLWTLDSLDANCGNQGVVC